MYNFERFICIPESVYSDKKLKANELVLYGLIYSMSQKDGFCWCSNTGLADRLNTSVRNIARWIAILKNLSYISIIYEYQENTQAIKQRKIYINQKGNDNSVNTYCQNCHRGDDKNGAKVMSKMAHKNIKENINNVEKNSTTQIYEKEIAEIVKYLNYKTGKNFRTKCKSTIKLISARLKESYTVDDFKCVIDNQVTQWINDNTMQKFLRPETLFAPSHFESYLNSSSKNNEAADKYRGYDEWN